jgi:integrase
MNEVGRTCQCCAQGKDARRTGSKQRCCALGRCCRDLPSATTVAHVRRVLRTVLSQAIADGLVTQNVAKLVKLPTVRRRRRASWSSDEARRFLESARQDSDPLYAAYVLVLVMGLRKGELLGLAWDGVDLRDASLRIEWQVQRISTNIVRRETKSATSDAVLPLPAICVTAPRGHQQRHAADADRSWKGASLIFITAHGTPIEPRNFNRYWDRRCDLAGVRRITVHDARRTCGSLLADLDVHPRVAMQILRHHDGDLHAGVFGGDPECIASAGRVAGGVVGCCTFVLYDGDSILSGRRLGVLSWGLVGRQGLEP